ncbi:MAG: response regulator [Anaerolineae bacterium]|nr:response regulator [Anaerolineae bacterium]MDW8171896.1 response regulator [Anaerolineae bacterium]
MPRILYIEDNPLNMKLVRKLLADMGYGIIEASDGEYGIRQALTASPDLILMDINLPDVDGLTITQRLKSDPHLRHIPVIALTANNMHGDREQCLAAGCDAYLAKPVSRLELRNVLERFLRGARS